jgi:hypothetical protein
MRSGLERLIGRPLLVRDRVLRAVSDDGLVWQKDDSVHLTHPSHNLAHMTYYTAHDSRGRLWLRASVHDPATDAWHTEMGRPGERSWWDARVLGLAHLYAPCWMDGRLYGVGVTSGGRPEVVCFETGEDELPMSRIGQQWERIAQLGTVRDLCIFRADDESHAWVCLGSSMSALRIHHWQSADGVAWSYRGPAVAAPAPTPVFDVAESPSVTADAGGWRMYFRTGDRPALGNVIRSAYSNDLESWRHEEGVRVAPGGRWDSHGVGFPRVWKDARLGWVMLYAGYWGRVGAAGATARHWEELGRRQHG